MNKEAPRDRREKAEWVKDVLEKPLTPKSERRYPGRIAPVGIPDKGCPQARCILSAGHDAAHWPGD